MTRTVYVNGEYLPETEASISIFDRGFLMADGVYEVTSVLDGKLIDFAILPLADVQFAQSKQFRNDIVIHQPALFTHKMYHFIHNRHKSILSALEAEIIQIKLKKELP